MKHDTYGAYSEARTQMAESALLTAWDSLAAFQDDLVLIGGLAIRHLTQRSGNDRLEAVTTDVDFGVSLGVSNGQYGSLRETLRGQGFRWERGRFQKEIAGVELYIDLLTERDGYNQSTVMVDDGLEVAAVPGLNRALAHHRRVPIEGRCLLNVSRRVVVKVAEIGPLLVLKLNAFGGPTGRKQPKDVSDLMLAATRYLDGVDAAVADFRAEVSAQNSGAPHALAALRQYFGDTEALGPVSCAAFRLNKRHRDPESAEESMRIRQQCVTIAQALLG
jgi:hypothetical protein